MNESYIITLIVTGAVAALGFFMKLQLNDIRDSLKENNEEIKEVTDKLNKRIENLENKTQNEISKVKQEISNLKGDFSTCFVLREDYFRAMNGVEDKMKTMDSKLDRLLMKRNEV